MLNIEVYVPAAASFCLEDVYRYSRICWTISGHTVRRGSEVGGPYCKWDMVESIAFNRMVVGSTPTLAAM